MERKFCTKICLLRGLLAFAIYICATLFMSYGNSYETIAHKPIINSSLLQKHKQIPEHKKETFNWQNYEFHFYFSKEIQKKKKNNLKQEKQKSPIENKPATNACT